MPIRDWWRIFMAWWSEDRSGRVPVVRVQVADSGRAIRLQRELEAGLRRLGDVSRRAFPENLSVLVQQGGGTESGVPGYRYIGHDSLAQGARRVRLIVLSLQLGDRELTSDEVLRTLSDQYLALLAEEDAPAAATVQAVPSVAPAGRTRPAAPAAHAQDGRLKWGECAAIGVTSQARPPMRVVDPDEDPLSRAS